MAEFPYGRQYRPRAPVLLVRISSPGKAAAVLVAALADTGAAMTSLPADLPAQLGLPVAGRAIVAGFDGTPRIVPTHTVQIRVADYITVLRVIAAGTYALLGRDVLNALVIKLRGPDGIAAVDTT
ncbi:MAG TPA: retroviral-like aspartic protease family protein [bacterium]|nr:retroviral-like aspartic protease family protein [bacterium]